MQNLVRPLYGGVDKLRDMKILDGVSGSIKPGRFTLLLGPPGSGKSMLMRALAGQLRTEKTVKVGTLLWAGWGKYERNGVRALGCEGYMAFRCRQPVLVTLLISRRAARGRKLQPSCGLSYWTSNPSDRVASLDACSATAGDLR